MDDNVNRDPHKLDDMMGEYEDKNGKKSTKKKMSEDEPPAWFILWATILILGVITFLIVVAGTKFAQLVF